MLAAIVAGLVLLWCYARRLGWQRLRRFVLPVVVVGPIVLIGLYFAGIDLFSAIGDKFATLFMLNDEYRGLDSGGSGRTDLWKAAINLWLTHPVFGVGFKGHPDLMPDQMLAHNAFLGMLADLGTVGFIAYLLILIPGFYHVIKRGDRGLSAYPQRLAILVSYLVYGMLESRAFSFGNTYSLLFLLVVFDSSKHPIRSGRDAETRRETSPSAMNGAREPAGLISRSKA
jgi:O-antigen ligase